MVSMMFRSRSLLCFSSKLDEIASKSMKSDCAIDIRAVCKIGMLIYSLRIFFHIIMILLNDEGLRVQTYNVI